MDHTVHGILQARILEWVAYPFSSGSSRPRNRTGVSCIAGGFFTNSAIREAPKYLYYYYYQLPGVFIKVHGLSCTTACGILGPRPGIKPASPALKTWNLNHWTVPSRAAPVHLGNRKAQSHVQCLLSARQGLGVVFTTFFPHLKLKRIPGGRYFCFLMRKGSGRNHDLSSVPEPG